jgi:hypothetical protein
MSTPDDTTAGRSEDLEAVEGLTSTYPIQVAQGPRRTSAASSDVSDAANLSSISSLEDEASLQFFQHDPSLFTDDDSESESRNESYITPEDTSTLELPTELNGDEDLIDMDDHHCKLRKLHALIYENSVAAILGRGDLLVRHPRYDGLPQALQPSEIRRIADAISDRNDKSTQTQAYRSIECYNILQRICNNLRLLQQQDFCSATISLLCVNDMRHEVAELIEVEVHKVLKLCSNMKKHLEKSFELSEDASLLDKFCLSPNVLHGLEQMYSLEQFWAAFRGDDVSLQNTDQNLALSSSNKQFRNPSLGAVSPVSHGSEDSEWYERESFVQPGTESLISIPPKAPYHPITTQIQSPLTGWSSKGTNQKKLEVSCQKSLPQKYDMANSRITRAREET